MNLKNLEHLKKRLSSVVFLPDDAGYQTARNPWATVINHQPTLIIEAASTEDIIIALKFAVIGGLYVAVQSTGHGAASPCIGHMLIKANKLDMFTIKTNACTLTAQPGSVWSSILEACIPYSLAALNGFAGDVGVTGYTIGGGFGWLIRKYGTALDAVEPFEIVTAGLERLTVTRSRHADLFKGFCARSDFGIVTSLTLRLIPVNKVLTAKMHFRPVQLKEVLAAYREMTVGLQKEMTLTLAILPSDGNDTKFTIAVEAIYLGPVAPFVTGGKFLHFLRSIDNGLKKIRAAFTSDDYEVLRLLKQRFDPINNFRYNLNILPAGINN